MKKLRKNKKGFTLIELIVVIAILGILVSLAAPRFLEHIKDAQKVTMQADAKVLSNAALVYNIEKEAWPVADYTVIATITQGEGEDAEEINVVAIDKDKIADQIQSLKGKVSDYGIVTDEGSRQGSVYHLDGVEDRDGDKHYGVDLVDVAFDEEGNPVTEDDVTVEIPTP